MRVDVIACYYKQSHRAPFFWWGIAANKDYINKVYVVSDGPMEPWEKVEVMRGVPVPMEMLSHRKYPHGVGPSYNQGAEASASEYVFFVSFDQILQPDTVKQLLKNAHPTALVVGACDSIPESTTLDRLPYPEVLRRDTIMAKADQLSRLNRSWCFARNGHTLVHRETFLKLGGFRQEYAEFGYGLEDLDFGVRHALEYGMHRIIFGGSRTWHFSSGEPTLDERLAKMPKPEAFSLLANTAVRLYNQKWRLFCSCCWDGANDLLQVTHTDQPGGADVRLDCVNPTWIVRPAYLIETRLPNPWVENERRHLETLLTRLAPTGVIRIEGGPDQDALASLFKRHNIIIDHCGDAVEIQPNEDLSHVN